MLAAMQPTSLSVSSKASRGSPGAGGTISAIFGGLAGTCPLGVSPFSLCCVVVWISLILQFLLDALHELLRQVVEPLGLLRARPASSPDAVVAGRHDGCQVGLAEPEHSPAPLGLCPPGITALLQQISLKSAHVLSPGWLEFQRACQWANWLCRRRSSPARWLPAH